MQNVSLLEDIDRFRHMNSFLIGSIVGSFIESVIFFKSLSDNS